MSLRLFSKSPARASLLHVCILLCLLGFTSPVFGGATCTNAGAATATSWTRWECTLDVQGVASTLANRNPYLMKLKVTYTAAGQATRSGYASWDGVVNAATNTHRFRLRAQFPPTTNETTWTWTTSCESPSFCSADTSKTNPSLVSSGTVTVSKYSGSNPLYTGGPIRILSNIHYPLPELYQGNSRFVWAGDSAWAAPMRANAAEWDAYLENRRSSTNPTGSASTNATMLHRAGQVSSTPITAAGFSTATATRLLTSLPAAPPPPPCRTFVQCPTWPSGGRSKTRSTKPTRKASTSSWPG